MRILKTWPRLSVSALLISLLAGATAAWWIRRDPDKKADVLQTTVRDQVSQAQGGTLVDKASENSVLTEEQKRKPVSEPNEPPAKEKTTNVDRRTRKDRGTVTPKPSPRIGYLGPPVPTRTRTGTRP
jgi:hypothetical protein